MPWTILLILILFAVILLRDILCVINKKTSLNITNIKLTDNDLSTIKSNNNIKVNHFMNYYIDKNDGRQKEIDQCLENNISNKYIDNIYLVIDDKYKYNFLIDKYGNNKLKLVVVEKRPTFNIFFKIINQYSGQNDINILSNSDIYFDDTLEHLILYNFMADINQKICLALSRWDVEEGETSKHFKNCWSQDTWIFKGPVQINANDNSIGNFYLGKLGCDTRIAYELQKLGYVVSNPSGLIKTHHLHISNVRNYSHSDQVLGRKRSIPITYDLHTIYRDL